MQQNEIARENKFNAWTITKDNALWLYILAIGFPVGYHYLHKSEQELRDDKVKGGIKRDYY